MTTLPTNGMAPVQLVVSLYSMRCFACDGEEANRGVLCRRCGSDLLGVERLCPEQLQLTTAKEGKHTHGWLVDGFGRPHPLRWTSPESAILIGRDMRCDVAILDVGASQLHAELRYGVQSGAWFIVDRGSRNGVFVNGERVERSWLEGGDRLFFGNSVGFLFLDADDERDARADAFLQRAAEMAHPMATLKDATLGASLEGALTLQEAEGGGVARIGDNVVQLSLLQFELLSFLQQRRREQANGDNRDTAGFVASKTLLASNLSFETTQPTITNLKRLVRSVRNKFTMAGLGEVIESRQNLGYRLIVE